MAQNILAALTLGDINFIGNDLTWIEGLLLNYRLPTAALYHYLNLYTQAAKRHLDERGQLIIDWLDRLVDRAAG
jgi:hypothetical protein